MNKNDEHSHLEEREKKHVQLPEEELKLENMTPRG